MAEAHVRLYEGMFLINPATVTSSVVTAIESVKELLDRAGAEIVSIAKWDDRKLAYEIGGAKRGLYMLAYFRVDGRKITGIERDVNLGEKVMRCMILRADHLGETELQLAIEQQQVTLDTAKLESAPPAADEPEAQPVAAETSDDE